MTAKARGLVLNRSELADALGLDPRTIDKFVRRGMPNRRRADRSRGQTWVFDLADVVEWLREKAASEAAVGDAGGSLREARLRRELALADLAVMERDERAADLIEVDTAAAELERELAAIRSRLLAIPNRAAPALLRLKGAAAIRDALRRHIDEALDELSSAEDLMMPAPEGHKVDPVSDLAAEDDLEPRVGADSTVEAMEAET
ncbi:MAG: hypothetical protein ACQGVK_09895 [Myxococcota bacterium]